MSNINIFKSKILKEDFNYLKNNTLQIWDKSTNATKLVSDGTNNIVLASEDNDIIYTGSGNDLIIGTDKDEFIHGNRDQDTLYGGGGNDTLKGGHGNDVIHIGSGDNLVQGGGHQDTFYINGTDLTSNDTIDGGNGTADELKIYIKDSNVNLTADDFKNVRNIEKITFIDERSYQEQRSEEISITLANSLVNDTLTISVENSQQMIMNLNTLDLDSSKTVVIENVKKVNASGEGDQDNRTIVKSIYGQGDTIYTGKYYADGTVLTGTDKIDTYYLGANDLEIHGGNSQDIFHNVGKSDSTIYGGEGDDVINITGLEGVAYGESGDDVYNLQTDSILQDQIHAGDGFDKLFFENPELQSLIGTFNVEKMNIELVYDNINSNILYTANQSKTSVFLLGNDGDDHLIGTNVVGKSESFPLNGDLLYGMNGNDTLEGLKGDDSLLGWDGNDSLLGGEGNDYLEVGKGDDYVFAGEGDDYILLDEGSNIVETGAGKDIISVYHDVVGKTSYGNEVWDFDTDNDKFIITKFNQLPVTIATSDAEEIDVIMAEAQAYADNNGNSEGIFVLDNSDIWQASIFHESTANDLTHIGTLYFINDNPQLTLDNFS